MCAIISHDAMELVNQTTDDLVQLLQEQGISTEPVTDDDWLHDAADDSGELDF